MRAGLGNALGRMSSHIGLMSMEWALWAGCMLSIDRGLMRGLMGGLMAILHTISILLGMVWIMGRRRRRITVVNRRVMTVSRSFTGIRFRWIRFLLIHCLWILRRRTNIRMRMWRRRNRRLVVRVMVRTRTAICNRRSMSNGIRSRRRRLRVGNCLLWIVGRLGWFIGVTL